MNEKMQKSQINQLIQKYTQSEIKDFSELYNVYHKMIRSILYKMCAPEDMEDLMQDVFLKIINGLAQFNQKSSLKTWIYRVACNHALDHLRKKKPITVDYDLQKIGGQNANSGGSNQDIVIKTLQKLSPDHRAVLVLVCLEELTIEEASMAIGVPQGTIKSRLHHAKGKMYELLSQQGVNL